MDFMDIDCCKSPLGGTGTGRTASFQARGKNYLKNKKKIIENMWSGYSCN
jgi:hypothetical protein